MNFLSPCQSSDTKAAQRWPAPRDRYGQDCIHCRDRWQAKTGRLAATTGRTIPPPTIVKDDFAVNSGQFPVFGVATARGP